MIAKAFVLHNQPPELLLLVMWYVSIFETRKNLIAAEVVYILAIHIYSANTFHFGRGVSSRVVNFETRVPTKP